MPRRLHRWADKSAKATFCTACGCDRTNGWFTRAGADYQTMGWNRHGWPRGKGWCDAAWPDGWIPVNAPAGFAPPAAAKQTTGEPA